MNDHTQAGRLLLAAAALMVMLLPRTAAAGMILDAELRFTYEDNVVGLLSDQQAGRGGGTAGTPPGMMAPVGPMGRGNSRYAGSASVGAVPGQSPGDYSTTLSAEAGGYTDRGPDTTFYAKGFASHTAYGTYTDLDETDLGATAGAIVSLGDVVTARMSVVGRLKRFGDSARDSTAYAADAGLKERLTKEFWLRESVEYEKNNADAAVFSYTGTTFDVGAGYQAFEMTTFVAGVRYLAQSYDAPSGATVDTKAGYVGIEQELAKSWALSGEYERQVSDLSVSGRSETDNILSLAVRYSY